jgi:hypothetical protein
MIESVGLLANAKSDQWDITIDQSHDGIDNFLHIEGPKTYLYFPIKELSLIKQVVSLLNAVKVNNVFVELELGTFADVPVTIRSYYGRCFLSIGKSGDCFAEFEISELDQFIDCFEQLQGELWTVPSQ